jgi:hypothetical protein
MVSFNKLPGFPKISGYRQMNSMSPAIIATQAQSKVMIDRLRENTEWAKTRDIVQAESPPSSFGIVKDTIFVKMVEGATRSDRSKLTNSLLAVIEDRNLFLLDTISFAEDMQKTMKLVEFFNFITSMICFILGAFQLVMTIAANINDSMWELGVLRSMGCTRE